MTNSNQGDRRFNGLQTHGESPHTGLPQNQYFNQGAAYTSVGQSQQFMSPSDGLGLNMYDL